MKGYTNLEQSKKLAEILPLESADMYYDMYGDPYFINASVTHERIKNDRYYHLIPCWSLAALLELLKLPTLKKDSICGIKIGWMITYYINGMKYDTKYYNNAVDACYEMILKLHELNLL